MDTDTLTSMYKERPEIIEWINFPIKGWKRRDFLDFLLKNPPSQPLTLWAYSSNFWSEAPLFLKDLLFSELPIASLKCPIEGTALSSLIQERCLRSNLYQNNDYLIFKLIKRGIDVNENTPLGKPLNHLLYMSSNYIENMEEESKEATLLIVDALLDKYEKSDPLVGMSLDPARTEKMHGQARQNVIEEYMQTPLGSTLVFDSASQLYYKYG